MIARLFTITLVCGFLLSGTTAGAQVVLEGDPVDIGGRAFPMMPGLPLVLPGEDLVWGTQDDVVDTTLTGDIDLVVRVGGHVAPSVPPPSSAPGGAGLLDVIAGGGSTGQGFEASFTVLVSDGTGQPPYGAVLSADDLDGRPVLVYGFADLDDDGIIGPHDADGVLDNLVELQELYAYVGRQVGRLDGGRFRSSIGLNLGAPTSIGGMTVVLVAGVYTGADAAVTFTDGTPIFTRWPFFPPLNPSDTLGNGNTPPPDPDAPTEVKWEVNSFLLPDPSDPVLGGAFAIPTDGSDASTDQLVVHSDQATAAMFFQPINIASYRPIARTRLRPAPTASGGRELVLPTEIVTLPGAGAWRDLRLLPVDFLGNVADPAVGMEATVVAGGGFQIVYPDSDGDPFREVVYLGSANGVNVRVMSPAAQAQGSISVYLGDLLVNSASLIVGHVVDSDGDGVADDGDGSGIVGDAPCGPLITGASCDDNCPFTINPNQADDELTGVGDCCGGDCILDGEGSDCGSCATSICAGARADLCDDGNACTVDLCDPTGGGCMHLPVECPLGESCDSAKGRCMPGDPDAICMFAATDPSAIFFGAMTTGFDYTPSAAPPFNDEDSSLDALAPSLLYAESPQDSLAGGSGDEVSYSVVIPFAGNWALWGRFYYPGNSPGDADSFSIRFDGSGPIAFGDDAERLQEWHWDGSADSGAAAPLNLGMIPEGVYELVVEKREVVPTAPRLDLLCLIRDRADPPADHEALALALARCGIDAECDDGNACTDDICGDDGLCAHPLHACDDSDICTNDSCDSTSGCLHMPIVCDDGDPCTEEVCIPGDGCRIESLDCGHGADCPPQPIDGCRGGAPGRARLAMYSGGVAARSKLKWVLNGADETSLAAFLDPPSGQTDYRVCVYDSSAVAQPRVAAIVPADADCGGRACWNPAGRSTFKFRNPSGVNSDGIVSMKVAAGAQGRARLSALGRGGELNLPLLDLQLPVRLQLTASTGEETHCWEASYSQSRVGSAESFRARGD